MKFPDTRQMQPEQALLDEIKFLSTQNPNSTNDQSTEYAENTSVPVDRNDLDATVAALIDLGTNLVDDAEDYNDTVHNQINHHSTCTHAVGHLCTYCDTCRRG